MRVSRELADLLVSAWEQDLSMRHFVDKFPEYEIYAPQSVRVFIAKRNFIANDLLWDGKPISAKKALRKFGLAERKTARSRIEKAKPHVLMTSVPRLSGQKSAPQHDWHYVK